MDAINPLSLLEVTMGEENNEDDDCIIIEDNDADRVNSLTSASQGEKMELEIDPLLVGPTDTYQTFKENDMTTLWVTTNINNLAYTSQAEAEFRKKKYQNIYGVLKEKLHCSICQDHVGCDIRVHPSSIEHPVLKVLICEKCAIAYRTVHFVMSEKGKEINCRWCGKVTYDSGPSLRTCQQCPFSFCEMCIYNNCPTYNEPRFPWTCFVCNMRALWPARATLWALHNLKGLLLGSSENNLAKVNGDISLCCKGKKNRKKKVVSKNASQTVVNPFHLDQLVLPHLLNGSSYTEHELQPEVHFGYETVKGYPVPKEFQTSTPRPKPKAKPRPKLKRSPMQQEKKLSSLVFSQVHCSVPIVAVPPEHHENATPKSNKSYSSCKKEHWLSSKLSGYVNDFDQLKIKLEDIEKTLDVEETNDHTDEKIDAITTLLSLQIDLMKNCRLNLINEWKERKARAVLEQYDPNTLENNGTTQKNPSPTVPKTPKLKKQSKPTSRKKLNARPRNNTNKKQFVELYKKENIDYAIKDCFVKLKKLEIPLSRDKKCFIKLERIGYDQLT